MLTEVVYTILRLDYLENTHNFILYLISVESDFTSKALIPDQKHVKRRKNVEYTLRFCGFFSCLI